MGSRFWVTVQGSTEKFAFELNDAALDVVQDFFRLNEILFQPLDVARMIVAVKRRG
jgi:hypothetical protein